MWTLRLTSITVKKENHTAQKDTCDIEGWEDAAWEAAFWRDEPDPPKSTETDFSLFTAAAAATALKEDCFTNPPSCSANTNVLIYTIIKLNYKEKLPH